MYLRFTFLFFILLFSAFFFSSSSACNNSSAFLDASWKQTSTQLRYKHTWRRMLRPILATLIQWLDAGWSICKAAYHSMFRMLGVDRCGTWTTCITVGNHSQLLSVSLTISKQVDLSSLPPSYLHTSNDLRLGVAKNGVHKNFRHFWIIGIHQSLHVYHNT